MENLKSGNVPDPQWMIEVDNRMHMSSEERNALPLNNILQEFQQYVEKEGANVDPKKITRLAGKIRILAEDRLHYFENSAAGAVVKEIFNVANFFGIKNLKFSSAEVGIELTKRYSPLKLDPKFVCDESTFKNTLPELENLLKNSKEFNTIPFLTGPRGASEKDLALNQKILDDATNFMKEQVEKLVKEKSISHEGAYKLLIGVLDKYDDEAIETRRMHKGFEPSSTFALRSAILLASVSEGIELQSWMVYTKSGKAVEKDLWPFLDNWKNWIPEAQGAMAKFAETTFIQARELAKYSREIRGQGDTDQVIMLKGGFGAGKTRFIGKLPSIGEEHSQGVVAPDLGKRVVRRAMESVPHASAHIQGSQIAYTLFDEMIQHQVGDVVYDSSLAWSSDVESYLEKSQNAGKKMVVFDIARNDMARALSVLKRSVGGDDPRIGPDFIIKSALNDKTNRAACMQVVLNAKIKDGQEAIAPEYRFVGADAKGWGGKEVMLIRPGSITKVDDEMKARLALEGIEVDEKAKIVRLMKSKEEFENYYKIQFERPVKDLLAEIETANEDDKSEYERLSETFSGRSFDLTSAAGKPIEDTFSLYEALPEKIKKALPKKALEEALNAVGPDTRRAFFESIRGKNSFSYHDLPLTTALMINKNLQGDPWV